jgi:hypothetical protein
LLATESHKKKREKRFLYLYGELRYVDWRDSFERRQALQTFPSLLLDSDDKCILNGVAQLTS